MDLSAFERGVRKQRRVIAGFFGSVLTLLAVAFVNIPPPIPGVPVGPLLAVLCLLGSGLAIGNWLRPIESNQGLRVLRHSPEDVVWFYPKRHLQHGRHVASSIMLRLSNGKTIQLAIAPMQEEAACLATLRAGLPRALSGYDGALEARFRTDPRSLLKPA